MKNVIHDGYSEQGYISATPGFHGELRFTYRPMLPEEGELFLRDEFKRHSPETAVRMMSAALAEKLVSWSEQEPVTVDNVRRLRPRVLNRLFGIVAGWQGSDLAADAGAGSDVQDGYAKRLLEAAAQGTTPAALTADRDAKNSVAG